MHGEAAAWQKRLRREFDTQNLYVRWNEEIERYQIGQEVRSGSEKYVDWFFTLTDGHEGYRAIDAWVIHRLRTLDKNHQPNWTPARYRRWLEDENREYQEKQREELRYKLAHEAKFASGRFWRVTPPQPRT